ncbi:Uncharacterised protein [Pseudomonas aeruginosa]|nr:Uncharacterised protein [Pseudomonas aeruginosa]
MVHDVPLVQDRGLAVVEEASARAFNFVDGQYAGQRHTQPGGRGLQVAQAQEARRIGAAEDGLGLIARDAVRDHAHRLLEGTDGALG